MLSPSFAYALATACLRLRFALRKIRRLPHSKRLSTFFHGRPCHIPTIILNFQTLIEAQFGYSLLNGSIELSLSIRLLKIPSGSLSWTSFQKCLRTFSTSPFAHVGGFRFAYACFTLRNFRFLKIPSGSLSWTSFQKCLRTFSTSPFAHVGGFRFAYACFTLRNFRFLKIPSGSLSWTSFQKCLRTFFTSPFVRLGGFRFASPYGIFACHIPTLVFNF